MSLLTLLGGIPLLGALVLDDLHVLEGRALATQEALQRPRRRPGLVVGRREFRAAPQLHAVGLGRTHTVDEYYDAIHIEEGPKMVFLTACALAGAEGMKALLPKLPAA